jgi:hypothetical protein
VNCQIRISRELGHLVQFNASAGIRLYLPFHSKEPADSSLDEFVLMTPSLICKSSSVPLFYTETLLIEGLRRGNPSASGQPLESCRASGQCEVM